MSNPHTWEKVSSPHTTIDGDFQDGSSHRALRANLLPLLAASSIFGLLCLTGEYSLDEFQYAHAAWAITKGQMPYRDFFEHHHPLVYQVLSPVFMFGGDHPGTIRFMRLGMMLFAIVAGAAAWRVNARYEPASSGLAVFIMAIFVPFSKFMSQIRPDSSAFALFIACIGVLRIRRLRDSAAAAIAGGLAALAFWGSQKALYYETALFAAFLLDCAARRTQARCLRSPAWFIAGYAAGLVPPAAYLTITGTWKHWWRWCMIWAVEHQRHYPGFPWTRHFLPVAVSWWAIMVLMVLGIVVSAVRNRRKWLESAEGRNDMLLLFALVSTFLSFAVQRAAFPYSLVPFLGIASIFAARGIAGMPLLLPGNNLKARRALQVGLAAVLLAGSLRSTAELVPQFFGNSYQHVVFERIQRLTAPGDTAYDNSGSYVSRPHSCWFYYTDALLRRMDGGNLAAEVPKAIVRSQCVMHLIDHRYSDLPPRLRAFLDENFQPYDADIRLWGKRFVPDTTSTAPMTFHAIRDDEYFFCPAGEFAGADLRIDGKRIVKPIFTLRAGEHSIETGRNSGSFYILWLPANGKPYRPMPGLKPRFSVLL